MMPAATEGLVTCKEVSAMPQPAGFYLPLSLPRRLMNDVVHFARQVPSTVIERPMNLACVAAARDQAIPKPSWCALFTKAWGMACAANPPLRRAYLGGPWPRLYQHPVSVATIAVERPYGHEDAVFFLQVSRPERQPLTDIDGRIKWFKDRPLGSAAIVRRQLRLARQPWFIRRPLWWLALNSNGRYRARLLGTFAVTACSGLGAETLHPPCLLTSTLSYGVIDPDGDVVVRVSHDSRTLDSGLVARALADLERFLKHEIVAELRYLQGLDRMAA
jgi:hypothetical protein